MVVGFMLLWGATTEAEACSQMQGALRAVMPADGAADVPAGSVVRVAFNGGHGIGAATYAWTGPDGNAVPFDVALATTGGEGPAPDRDYAELDAAETLADGVHTITVTLDGVVVGTSAFTVDGEVDISTPDAPSAADLVIADHVGEPRDECDQVDTRYVSLTITPDAVPNSVVHVRRASGEVVASFAVVDALGPVTWIMDIVPGDEECLTLVQENALGDVSEPSEPICASLGVDSPEEEDAEPEGCQTARGPASAGVLLLLAGLVTRRKRA